jgi:subfamily B ATP-binding cassette protein MsbA
MKTYLRLLKYVKPYAALLILSIICASAFSSVNVLVIPAIGKLSEAIGSKNAAQLNSFVFVIVGLYIARGVFSFAQRYFAAHADQGITKDLRMRIFEHLQDLSLDFYSKTRTGEIIMIVMNNINIMQSAILDSFTSIIPSLLTIIGITGYLLTLNWKLALISFITLPFITLLSARFGMGMKDVAEKTQEKVSDITSMLHEVVTGAKIVKSFTMEHEEIKKFDAVTDHMKKMQLKMTILRAAQNPLFSVAQAVAAVIVIWFGGSEIISGAISPSNLIAFFSGVVMLGEPIAELSGINITLQMALIAANRYFKVLDTVPSVKDAPSAREAVSIRGEVEYKGVSYKYETSNKMVLKDINFTCREGEAIAIVGHSGAGKTTLVGLIPRFYDAIKGEILIDGLNIKEYKILSLRKFIGIVPQETLLFSGTIRDNIAYGRKNATEKEVIEVAKMANAHDFIMSFPAKYDTMIGEKGIRLSGGERQRISIARAFLRDPKILILDEATSSLDSGSEKLIQGSLEKLMQGRTTFIIAHRLSTVRFADRILVLKAGEVIEEGTHEELLKAEGEYHKLHKMQQGVFAGSIPKVFGSLYMAQPKVSFGGRNIINGWVIADNNEQISRVRIMCKDKVLGKGFVDKEIPKVAEKFPNYNYALKSGFRIDFEALDDPDITYNVQVIDVQNRILKTREIRLLELEASPTVAI